MDEKPRLCEILAAISYRPESADTMFFNWQIRRLAVSGLIGFAMLAGCASEQAMPKTASSASGAPGLASQARRMRSGEADRDGSGLSSQSRDVEKDLGLR